MTDDEDEETAALELMVRILDRAPEQLRGATTYEILKHLSEQGDIEATAALSELTSRERIQWSHDLKKALVWDNWIDSESGKFRPTDKSEFHDSDDLVKAYREALPGVVENIIHEEIERQLALGVLESFEKDGETYYRYRRAGSGEENDEGR